MKHTRREFFFFITTVLSLAGCSQPPATSRAATVNATDDPATLHISGGVIEIDLVSRPAALSQDELRRWIETAGRAVSTYYGRFPVKRITLEISVNSNGHEIHGRTFNGERINMGFGPAVAVADLKEDWILTHEMFHLAFPDMGDEHEWMNEGLSTYLEPIARAGIGGLPAERVWHDMVEGMPQGQPEAGDRGLDRTHTWGRTYWGGCLFWLMADIRIREQTRQRQSLRDAMRAILDAGGDGSAEWPVARVLEVGDHATGTRVLKDLNDEMALKPLSVDLDALWKRLGVRRTGDRATFDETAPLAGIRREITSEKHAQ